MTHSQRILIGGAVSVVFLGLFLVTVDLGRMLDTMARANYVYAGPGVALYLLSLVFRTLRWQRLLSHLRPIGTVRLYPVVVVGYMANNLLPMRLGEVARSYHLGSREGISKTAVLATILVERVLDALTLLFFIALIAAFVPLSGLVENLGGSFGVPGFLLPVLFGLPFLVLFCLLILSAMYPRGAGAAASLLLRWLPPRLRPVVGRMTETFLSGLTPLSSPRTLAALFLLSVPIWLLESGLFLMVALSFGLDEVFGGWGDLLVAQVLVTAIANIGSSVPGPPGGVGLFELVAREALVFMPMASVERPVAAGYAAVVHLLLIVPVVLLGQVFLWTEHLSLRKLSEAAGEPEAGSPVAYGKGKERES